MSNRWRDTTSMARLRQKYGIVFAGIVIGVVYGLVARFVFGESSALPTVAFFILIPAFLGILPLLFANKDVLRSYRNIIFIPWITVATFFLTMYVMGVEGLLCLVILAGPFFLLATLGAFLYRIQVDKKRRNKSGIMVFALIPFLLGPVEEYIKRPSATYTVRSEVIISATPETIWSNIVEVSTIRDNEYNDGVLNELGIPRPIGATVNKKEVGGQRIGRFEGGLRFVETITRYEPNSFISFDITVDPNTVRPIVFDQHVLNGNYFSFVDASYELVPLSNGQVRLILSSKYQLTSTINYYGKVWGDIILEDFQDRLLDVIAKRCEAK